MTRYRAFRCTYGEVQKGKSENGAIPLWGAGERVLRAAAGEKNIKRNEKEK